MSGVRRALCSAVLILSACVSCGSSAAGSPPSAGPTTVVTINAAPASAAPASATPTTSVPAIDATSVSGHAVDDSGTPVDGVTLGFRSTDSPASCATCIHFVATDVDGAYSLRLAPDSYRVACFIARATCAIGNSSAGAPTTVRVQPGLATLDVHVSTAPAQPTHTTEPSHPTAPDPPEAPSFSGKVTFPDGRLVRGSIIEFKAEPSCESCSQPYVKSDASGHYTIKLSAGVYNALCVVEDSDEYLCGPRGGDDNPHPVEVPPSGQHLDFVICPSRQYPACLR